MTFTELEALRNEVARLVPGATVEFDSTPLLPEMEADPERFRLYRLCACGECNGNGKKHDANGVWSRCKACRGEGRNLDLVATCGTPEAVGVAVVTLGREGEWAECPVGCLDTMGEHGKKWIFRPWTPSARNISDAGRMLRSART